MSVNIVANAVLATSAIQVGNSAVSQKNLSLKTNLNNTFSLFRGDSSVVAQEVLKINADGSALFPIGITSPKVVTTAGVSTSTVKAVNGSTAIDMAKLAGGGRYTRNSTVLTDTSPSFTCTTTWVTYGSFAAISGVKAGSLIRLFYHFPNRSDSASWGGLYIEPQININAGTWQSLGSCGYDGHIMVSSASTIDSYNNNILIDPGQPSDFSVQFRFYVRSYDGTTYIGLSGTNINAVSGTATIMSGNNGLQHHAHIIVDEYAILRGAT